MEIDIKEVKEKGLKRVKFSTLKPYFDFQSLCFTRVRGDDGWDKVEYYIKA